MRATPVLYVLSAVAVAACLGGCEGGSDRDVGQVGGAIGWGGGGCVGAGGDSVGWGGAGGHPDCERSWFDGDCRVSTLMDGCPEGHHIGLAACEHCPSCVPDEPPPDGCAEGRGRYLQFLTDVIEAGCADYCWSNGDCSRLTVDNACFSGCQFGLDTWIDESIVHLAELFAAENCASCEGPVPSCPAVATGSDVACVDQRCVLVP